MAEKEQIPIDSGDWLSLQDRYTSSVTGTIALPGRYPPVLLNYGIRPRNLAHNVLLGTTASVPTENHLALGLAYDHRADHHTDEDMFIVDGEHLVIRPFYRGTYEHEDKRYAGSHRGNKDYLRVADSIAALPALP